MDHNVIQNPDVIKRLASRLGMRQAHIAPTLNEGVQPVVIVDDVSSAKENMPVRTFAGIAQVQGNPATPTVGYTGLENPTGSGVVVRLRRMIITINGQLAASADLHMALDVMSPVATNIVRVAGVNMAAGTTQTSKSRGRMVLAEVPPGSNLANRIVHVFLTGILLGGAGAVGPYQLDWNDAGPAIPPGKMIEIEPELTDSGAVGIVSFLWQEEPEN